MYLVSIEFSRPNGRVKKALYWAASELLSAWIRNGQVLDSDVNLVTSHNKLLSVVPIPARYALSKKHSSKSVQRALHNLEGLGALPPRTILLGRNLEAGIACRCKRRPFLILFTHLFSIDSPIRCGTCF